MVRAQAGPVFPILFLVVTDQESRVDDRLCQEVLRVMLDGDCPASRAAAAVKVRDGGGEIDQNVDSRDRVRAL